MNPESHADREQRVGRVAGVARVAIGARPPASPQAQAWVRQGDGADIGKTDLYTARMTLDVTPALRARIKVTAFTQGITVAEMLRDLLDTAYPENTP
jgi:hypothetical protein